MIPWVRGMSRLSPDCIIRVGGFLLCLTRRPRSRIISGKRPKVLSLTKTRRSSGFVFGNPTRNTGRFRECFPGGKHSGSWTFSRVDSRTVRVTNKRQIAKWAAAYGEDSDFFRVRVKGSSPHRRDGIHLSRSGRSRPLPATFSKSIPRSP